MLKKKDKFEAKETGCKKKTIMVDLQKCLPTPYLTNGQSFYLKKLWTLNLTIHNDTLNKATCVIVFSGMKLKMVVVVTKSHLVC